MNSRTCSVIVPIYNAAPFLAQCLSSIKMQTYQDLQVILVDDGSTDESGDIARSFVEADKRFTLLEQSNQGQSAARNSGLKKAIGEYLVFVDADDYLDNDFIEKHIAALGDADYVQSGYRRVSTDGAIIEQKLPIHRYQFTVAWGRLYRTSSIKKHQLHFKEGIIYEDVIFSLLLWNCHPKIIKIDYCGYNYTYNPLSTTATPNTKAQQRLYHSIWKSKAPLWIKLITYIRLIAHFGK